MNHHLICITIDTDPDGLSGVTTDRRTLVWDGLQALYNLPEDLRRVREQVGQPVPITWFLRVDGQLRDILGDALYLWRRHERFWRDSMNSGHEIGWHPHLYRQASPKDEPRLLLDEREAVEELARLWEEIGATSLKPVSFRNGEGWHTTSAYEALERFGLRFDSTAIPGRKGSGGHPMDWIGTPNQPYYPDRDDLRKPGAERSLLEIPINTWRFQTQYDTQPRIRYMNLAVHSHYFDAALASWEESIQVLRGNLFLWVFVCHPDELLPAMGADLLYGRSRSVFARNLVTFAERIMGRGDSIEFLTVSDAGVRWRTECRGVKRDTDA